MTHDFARIPKFVKIILRTHLARRTMNPLRFEFDGVSPMPILVGRLYERLVGTKMLHRVYEQNGRLIGFMRAKVDRKSQKGVINRFILD